MSDITLTDITSGYNLSLFNANFQVIEDVINDEVLHLTGGNNVMLQDIDMNSNTFLNLADAVDGSSPVTLDQVMSLIAEVNEGLSNFVVDTFVDGTDFNTGVTTTLTLSSDPGVEDNLWVWLDNVRQPTSAYSVTGDQLIFSSAIVGTEVEVQHGTTLPPESVTDVGSVRTIQPFTDEDITLVASHNNAILRIGGSVTSFVTVPTNAENPLPIGFETHIRSIETVEVTVLSSITVNPPAGGTLVVTSGGGEVTLRKVAADEWDMSGNSVGV